jgi:hypothetical protein
MHIHTGTTSPAHDWQQHMHTPVCKLPDTCRDLYQALHHMYVYAMPRHLIRLDTASDPSKSSCAGGPETAGM